MSLQTHNEIELEKALQELTSTQMGRRLFLQAAPLLIASACATKSTKARTRAASHIRSALALNSASR